MTDTQSLLAEYVRTGSDTAFRELVVRYINLVHSTALRLVSGDTHRAEDVAQTVFVDLARQAGTFSPDVLLGGWLHRHTCFVAANTLRGERRRQIREREATEMKTLHNDSGMDFSLIAPILDESINQLSEEDRTAILLRFFEQRDFRSVGEALDSTEDAARMRVTRALEKLHLLLKRHRITTGTAALGLALSANAVQAAPAGLAAAISGTTLATTTVITKAAIMTTLQKTIVTASVVALAGAGIYGVDHLVQTHRQAAPPQNPANSAEDYVSHEQFAFAGYATPEAAVKSIFWVQSRGDVNASLNGLSPKVRSLLETELKTVPESQVAGSMINADKNILGYRITGLDKISDDKIVVSILVNDARLKQIGPGDNGYYALMAKSHKKWQLVRINSEWKYDGAPDAPKQ